MRLAIDSRRKPHEIVANRCWEQRQIYPFATRSRLIQARHRRTKHRIQIAFPIGRYAFHGRGIHHRDRAGTKLRQRLRDSLRQMRDWIGRIGYDRHPGVACGSVGGIDQREVEKILAYVYSGDWCTGFDEVAGGAPWYSNRYSLRPPMTFFT